MGTSPKGNDEPMRPTQSFPGRHVHPRHSNWLAGARLARQSSQSGSPATRSRRPQRSFDRTRTTLGPVEPSDDATVTLRDSSEQVEIDVDLPGLTPDDVRVTVDGHRVRLRGASTAADQARQNRVDRTLRFDAPIDADRVEATADESTVTVTLPKRGTPDA